MHVILNIGLVTSDKFGEVQHYGSGTALYHLLNALRANFMHDYSVEVQVRTSDTEDTAIVELKGIVYTGPVMPDVTPQARFRDMLYNLCHTLRQDCIAALINGEGFLVGPYADAWGEFNADYFLMPTK